MKLRKTDGVRARIVKEAIDRDPVDELLEILKQRNIEVVFDGQSPKLTGDTKEVSEALLQQLKHYRQEVIERVKPHPRGRILDREGNTIIEFMDHAPTPGEFREHNGYAAEHWHNGQWKRYLTKEL